jgi:hypothetical protein
VPKVISPSDPCSAWTAKANKRVQFGYGLNYLIDTENAVIVDVEATPARTYDEVAATKAMIDRTERRFALKPKRLAADTAYGTGKFLGWLVNNKKITPHIPVWEKSARADGIFSRADFIWDKRHGLNGVKEIEIAVADGIALIAWYAPAKDDKPTILYFHGNGANAASRPPKIEKIRERGFGVLYLTTEVMADRADGLGRKTMSPTQSRPTIT